MGYEFARYLKVRGAWGVGWSPDGRRVSFLTEITGVPQVWEVDAGGGWSEQLTFHEERVFRVVASAADTASPAYTMASFVVADGVAGARRVGGVEVGDVKANTMLNGEPNSVYVTLRNSTEEPVEATASVRVPEGWSSQSATRVLAPQEEAKAAHKSGSRSSFAGYTLRPGRGRARLPCRKSTRAAKSVATHSPATGKPVS